MAMEAAGDGGDTRLSLCVCAVKFGPPRQFRSFFLFIFMDPFGQERNARTKKNCSSGD